METERKPGDLNPRPVNLLRELAARANAARGLSALAANPRDAERLSELHNALLATFGDLDAIASELRARKVNNGRHESPTLIAWADRIDAALERVRAPSPADPLGECRFPAKADIRDGGGNG